QLADLFIDDGPDLPSPGIPRKIRPLVSELGRETQPYRQVVTLGNRHARPDVGADPIPTAVRLNAGELVKSGLEPLVETMCNLQGFMLRVVGGQHSIDGSLGSFRREDAMQLEYRDALRHQLGGINLH